MSKYVELSAFERAAHQWSARGNRGVGRQEGMNLAPILLGELAEYFGSLTPKRLAGCWIGCVTEACLHNDFSAGDMSRALVVVAERLHGLKFEVIGTEIQLKDETCPKRLPALDRLPPASLRTSESAALEKHLIRQVKMSGRRSKS